MKKNNLTVRDAEDYVERMNEEITSDDLDEDHDYDYEVQSADESNLLLNRTIWVE